MCLMKSGESGKDCKGVAAQKDKRERNLCGSVILRTLLDFVLLLQNQGSWIAQWYRAGLVDGKVSVRVPVRAAGEFSSSGSTF